MYLHIGNKKSVKKKNIIGIFDLDTSTLSKTGKKFINKNQKEGRVVYDDFDLPRSFVLEDGDGEVKLRLSRISVQGLRSRLNGDIEE